MTPHCAHMTSHCAHITPHCAHMIPHCAHMTPHCAHMTPHCAHMTPHCAHMTIHCAHMTHSKIYSFLTWNSRYLTPVVMDCVSGCQKYVCIAAKECKSKLVVTCANDIRDNCLHEAATVYSTNPTINLGMQYSTQYKSLFEDKSSLGISFLIFSLFSSISTHS